MDSDVTTDRMASARAAKAAKHMPAPEADPPPKLVAVKLLRHYRPWACEDETVLTGKRRKSGEPIEEIRAKPFPADRVVGWHRPATMRKDAAGKPVEVEPALFIKGELPPSSRPGVGFAGKIWAGAVIRVPKDEAVHMRKNGIGEIEIDYDD